MSTTTRNQPADVARTHVVGAGARVAAPAATGPAALTARAARWVVTLVWVLPLAGFTVAALTVPSTGCTPTSVGACDQQGEVVLLAVMSAVLLIPVGLVALVLVRMMAGLGWRPPAFLLALASALGGAAAGGVLLLLGDLVT